MWIDDFTKRKHPRTLNLTICASYIVHHHVKQDDSMVVTANTVGREEVIPSDSQSTNLCTFNGR